MENHDKHFQLVTTLYILICKEPVRGHCIMTSGSRVGGSYENLMKHDRGGWAQLNMTSHLK